jgi:DNA-binding CsgD family transcriptional regulator
MWSNAINRSECARVSRYDVTKMETDTRSRLLSVQGWEVVGRRMCLSRREVQIAQAMMCDDKESVIGGRLGISPHTVHTYVERLYRKVGVSSRTALVVALAESYLAAVAEPGSSLAPVCGRRAAGRCPAVMGIGAPDGSATQPTARRPM